MLNKWGKYILIRVYFAPSLNFHIIIWYVTSLLFDIKFPKKKCYYQNSYRVAIIFKPTASYLDDRFSPQLFRIFFLAPFARHLRATHGTPATVEIPETTTTPRNPPGADWVIS